MSVYPVVTSPRSFYECPVHLLAVALDESGRIVSACPECLREAVRARARMRRKK